MTKKKKKQTEQLTILAHRASARAEVIGQIEDVLGGYEDILKDPDAFEDRFDAEAQRQSVEFQRDAVRFVLEYVNNPDAVDKAALQHLHPAPPNNLNLTPEDETKEV